MQADRNEKYQGFRNKKYKRNSEGKTSNIVWEE